MTEIDDKKNDEIIFKQPVPTVKEEVQEKGRATSGPESMLCCGFVIKAYICYWCSNMQATDEIIGGKTHLFMPVRHAIRKLAVVPSPGVSFIQASQLP